MHNPCLKGLTLQELTSLLESWGEKSYRARQLWGWMYAKPVRSFQEMTNLSSSFRSRLEQSVHLSSLTLVEKTHSKQSGTVKFLWKLNDGLHIESVTIPEGERRTVCISSQAGCPLGCAFCATGSMGWQRDLLPCEITDQVVQMILELGSKPTNIVLMGMGEPFLNYDNVMKALGILHHPDGIAIGHRKITVSTAGLVPELLRYTRELHPYKLAVSLNASTDQIRSRLMPINRKYPLAELMQAVRQYIRIRKSRVTFEYVLIKNINDSPEDAERLIRLIQGIPCKVNLIAYNPSIGEFKRPDPESVESFAALLQSLHAPVTLRLSKGQDIQGACGQLSSSRLPKS